MISWLKKRVRAETLMEVTISILVIALGSATAANLVVQAIRANILNKSALIAQNLAQEGIEYMHNLRDTNFMKFSFDPGKCWNVLPGESCPNNKTDTSNMFIAEGEYYLSDKIEAAKNDAKLDLENGGATGDEANFRLSYYDLNDTLDGVDVDGDHDNDIELIASELSGDGIVKVEPTKFYRSVKIDYFKDNGSGGLSDGTYESDVMIVTSKVQWSEFGRTNTVSLSSALTSHQ